MAKMFSAVSDEGLEESKDRLGGGGVLDSDIYTGKIVAFFAGKSKNTKARSITVHLDIDGKIFRTTQWVTNKEDVNYFMSQEGNKVQLPGFAIINEICLLTLQKPVNEIDFEEKVIKLYDYDEKKEVNKSVDMATEILGEIVSLGIQKQIVDKTENVNGEYVATGKTRETNEVIKVFHTDSKATYFEASNGVETFEFWDKWLEAHKGKIADKTKATKNGTGGDGTKGSGAPEATKTERKPLFAKK